MEDILASIRRIIAEDQSNSLGRSALGGLTRRSFASPAIQAPEPVAATGTSDHEVAPDVQVERQEMSAAETSHPVYAEPVMEAVPHFDHAQPSMDAEPAYRSEEPYATEAMPEVSAEVETMPAAAQDDVMRVEEGEPLMSSYTGASISSSFQTLAESVMLQDPGLIERVMRESMRPLLKAWLDDHLPSIVERLVRNEIERVARGGRGRNA